MNNIGDRIKELRISKELKQKQLAEILNVHASTINKYESNERVPELEILCKIADYFDVSVDFLLNRKEI